LEELAEEEMNRRQIRNAITSARQLAQFDGYSHLRSYSTSSALWGGLKGI